MLTWTITRLRLRRSISNPNRSRVGIQSRHIDIIRIIILITTHRRRRTNTTTILLILQFLCLVYIVQQGREHQIDIGTIGSRGFNKTNIVLLGIRSTLLRGYLAILAGQVEFVAHNDIEAVGLTLTLNLSEPTVQVLKGLWVGNVVDNEGTVGTAVVSCCNGTESILSCLLFVSLVGLVGLVGKVYFVEILWVFLLVFFGGWRA